MRTIRKVCTEDLSALLSLYVHLNPANAWLPETEVLHQTWAQVMSDPKLHCLVMEESGVLIGSCLLVIVPNLTRGARSFGLIENVVTHPDYRRQSVGTQLMRSALEIAWQQGCYKVMLLSGAMREEAHRFYESLGFTRDSKVGFLATPPPLSNE